MLQASNASSTYASHLQISEQRASCKDVLLGESKGNCSFPRDSLVAGIRFLSTAAAFGKLPQGTWIPGGEAFNNDCKVGCSNSPACAVGGQGFLEGPSIMSATFDLVECCNVPSKLLQGGSLGGPFNMPATLDPQVALHVLQVDTPGPFGRALP